MNVTLLPLSDSKRVKEYDDGGRYEGVRLCSDPARIGFIFFCFFTYFAQDLDAEGRRHGRGLFRNRLGDVYDGEWLNDRRSGNGTLTWSNGDTYQGQWLAGRMHGQGTFRWANGDTFVGQWHMGKMQGHGTKTMANGDVYVGVRQEDLRSPY